LWSEVSKLDPTPTGILLQKLDEKMWGNFGLVVHKKDVKNGRSFDVKYDRNYVADHLHRLFVNLKVNDNGQINRELLDEIIEYSVEYSLKEEERQKYQELLRLARPYMDEEGLSEEDAVRFVLDIQEFSQSWIAKNVNGSKSEPNTKVK